MSRLWIAHRSRTPAVIFKEGGHGPLLQNHIHVQKGNMFIAKISFPLGDFIYFFNIISNDENGMWHCKQYIQHDLAYLAATCIHVACLSMFDFPTNPHERQVIP